MKHIPPRERTLHRNLNMSKRSEQRLVSPFPTQVESAGRPAAPKLGSLGSLTSGTKGGIPSDQFTRVSMVRTGTISVCR
jgi:hypothetical protein